jgi:hypothetical protein
MPLPGAGGRVRKVPRVTGDLHLPRAIAAHRRHHIEVGVAVAAGMAAVTAPGVVRVAATVDPAAPRTAKLKSTLRRL